MKKLISFGLTILFTTFSFSQNATVKGVVKFVGEAPKPRLISMKADRQCDAIHGGKSVTAEDVVVNPNGTLKWVFVYVKEGVKGKYNPPSEPVVLDQQGCLYKPRVFGIMVGQKLEIRNSDPLLHNVHATPKKNKPFNIGQPVKGMKTYQTFNTPEIMVPFKCDVHPWMSAYAGVLDHPFFSVSNDKGEFEIKNLPPGTYTIEAWHEKFGTLTQTVTVKPGETKKIEFTFERKK
jgi:plastocyanin